MLPRLTRLIDLSLARLISLAWPDKSQFMGATSRFVTEADCGILCGAALLPGQCPQEDNLRADRGRAAQGGRCAAWKRHAAQVLRLSPEHAALQVPNHPIMYA